MRSSGSAKSGLSVRSLHFAVCRIIGSVIEAQFEAAASLEIAQVAGQKIAKPPHCWRDAAKAVSQVAEAHRGKAVVGWDEIARGKETDMRFISMALALAMMTGSALAQDMRDMGSMKGEGKGRHAAQSPEQQKIDRDKKKAAEDAYKSSLKSIPDSKIKDDPWRGVR